MSSSLTAGALMLSTVTPRDEESDAVLVLVRTLEVADAAEGDGMMSWTATATEAAVTTMRTSSASGNIARIRERKPARSKVWTSPLQLKVTDTTGL